MKALWRIVGLSAVAALAACEPLDDIDLGGGGTGGGAFSKGFVFVRERDHNLFAVDDTTGNPSSPLQLTTDGKASQPAVSPTGLQVAYISTSGGVTELRVVPTTGTGSSSAVISSTSSECVGCSGFRFPTFSPSGRTLVFTLNKGGYSQLAQVAPDGTGFKIFSSPSNGAANFYGAASFYPDGASVLAAASNSSARDFDRLVKVSLTDGAASVIATSLGGTAQVVVNRAVVSPDGTKVAFDGRTSNGSSIFVGNLGAGLTSVKAVTSHTGESGGVQDTWPSWLGNTAVGFQSDSGGNDNIYRGNIAAPGAGTFAVPGAQEPAYGGK